MGKMLKPKIKVGRIIFDILKVVCVISIFVAVIYSIPPLFKHKEVVAKSEIVTIPKKTEIASKKGSIDVLMIGNSSVYSGFNPLQMWKEHGYTSFSAAAPKQNMCLSYYTFKEILTVQNPKVLLLDISNLFETRGTTSIKENLQLVYTYSYPVFRDTSRWDEIQSKGVVQTKTESLRLVARGFYYSPDIVANTKGYNYMKETNEVEDLPEYSKTYLPKIMQLAKENNVSVVFTSIPCSTTWSYKRHNAAVKVAEEYNVDFIDMNIPGTVSDINWNIDSRDGGNHLNYNGSQRITTYVGNYLKQIYQLSDYRGNENFTDWDEDYALFKKRIKQ